MSPTSVRFNFSMPFELYRRALEAAAREERPLAAWLRMVIREKLDASP